MKNIKIYLAATALFAALSFAACDVEVTFIDPAVSLKTELLSETEYGIYKGETSLQSSLLFNKKNHQLYFAASSKCSRILSNDATKYVEVKLLSDPEPDVSTNGSITVEGLSAGVSTQSDLSVDVLKMEDGKCWLWCTGSDNTSFGAIIMWIK